MPKKPTGGLPPSGFGVALRRERDAKGMTQAQLADSAGLHSNTIAKMERGEVEPSWQVVIAIAKALGVDCTAFAACDDTQGEAEGNLTAKKNKPKLGKKQNP